MLNNILLLAAIISTIVSQSDNNLTEFKTSINTGSSDVKSASIIAVGDIMFHKNQITSAYDGKTYNFDPSFEDIKKEIQSSDLSIGNFETTVNPDLKFSGYPQFNAPEQTLKSLKDIGFDILVTSNNHSLDTGIKGLLTTLGHIRKFGMLPVGTGEKDEKKYTIQNINGIKIGVLAYTYGTNNALSGKRYANYINLINQDKIRNEIENIRKECDFIIVYLHTGTEYIRTIEKNQPDLFRSIANMGADCVLGNHPHVARDSETYTTKDGREVFINYSLGNFISNMDTKYTDIGLMVKLEIRKDTSTTLCCAEAIPLYRYRSGREVSVLKCEDALNLPYINNIKKEYISQINNELYYISIPSQKEGTMTYE